MKIYLSEYWIKNCLFTLFLTFAVVTGTVWFCFLYQVKEYYLFIVCVTLYIIIALFLIRTSLLFVRYVVKEGDQMVMYSFRKKRIASLNSDLNIYYEVISLTEGMYSKKEFIILSNMPFKSFQTSGALGLANICKAIDATGDQIIMPYDNKHVRKFMDSIRQKLIATKQS